MAADGHDRVRHYVAHGRESRSVGQLQVQARLRRGERSFRRAVVRCDELQLLDEIVVGIGDRLRSTSQRSVRHAQHRAVGADDVDVLDVLDVEELLQPSETPDGVLHRAQHGDLGGPVELRLTIGHPATRLDRQFVLDPGPQEFALIGGPEAVPAGVGSQTVQYRRADRVHESAVGDGRRAVPHRSTRPLSPTPGAGVRTVRHTAARSASAPTSWLAER